ncbi:MAG: hypothetical protein FWB95_00105 [Treponema sp.]|nr:hypothetical protein [Treponema sp.]
MNSFLKKLVLISVFIICASPLFSRDVIINVLDSDLDLPLEGATVRLRDGREYICDRNGRTVIQVPDDRQVMIYCLYPGYETGIITIPLTGASFTVSLNLSGVLQGRELVIEASRPDSAETRTGRSIAVTSKEIAQTAEIGIIEDVMSTISLLPGVGYAGLFDAEPSIRGGHPGDMGASLNGFFINNPFFWGGTFSIFDPRMVESAQLSHGVFSARFGHTISGLLEITTKNPSPTETQFELSVNTSAANFNFSLPLNGKGGIIFMGRITYYAPFLKLAVALSRFIPQLELLKSFEKQAPYIRTVTANGNYRFTENLELTATGFFGMDGVGIKFENDSLVNDFLNSETTIDFLFINYQTFFTTSLSYNPRKDMLLKFLAGVGYEKQDNLGDIQFNIKEKHFSKAFQDRFPNLYNAIQIVKPDPYDFKSASLIDQSESNLNLQGRIDYDWHISEKILLSSGIQVMYNQFSVNGVQKGSGDIRYNSESFNEQYRQIIKGLILYNYPLIDFDLIYDDLRIQRAGTYYPNAKNDLLTTSGYILGEFFLGKRFNAELGLRVDYFLLTGENDFRLDSDPALNPRLNLEFNLYNGTGFFNKIDLSAGTGLFSSINDNVSSAEERFNIEKIKPNRSWTSIIGIKFGLPESISLNIEGYYKYIFDRMYIPLEENEEITPLPKFDGEGQIWGLDVMLQKTQSRYWDGWIAYSFNWVKYRDPQGVAGGSSISGGNRGDIWYFPSFHRFHTLNFILNVKPVQKMNLYFRLGLASGVPLAKRDEKGPQSYPVYLVDQNIFIEKYYWNSYYDESNRTTPSFNVDFKFSLFGGYKKGKTRYEMYFAIENVLGLLYSAQGNTSFNQYTGELDEGSFSATFDLPTPIPSFGFRISY